MHIGDYGYIIVNVLIFFKIFDTKLIFFKEDVKMSYVDEVLEIVKKKNGDQPEFIQAVTEVLDSSVYSGFGGMLMAIGGINIIICQLNIFKNIFTYYVFPFSYTKPF